MYEAGNGRNRFLEPLFSFSSHEQNNSYLPFHLCQWLIVEKENGKRAYLKPDTVKYYEDADEEVRLDGK